MKRPYRWLFWGTIILALLVFFVGSLSIVGILSGLLISGAAVFAMMRWGTFRREYIWLFGGTIFTFIIALSAFFEGRGEVGIVIGLLGLYGAGTIWFGREQPSSAFQESPHKFPIHGTEKLQIVLVDEGMALGRSIIFAYFTPGSGRIEKHKFIARVFSSPNGAYNFDSEGFLRPITLASFYNRGVLIEASQSDEARDAWKRLRARIESCGWRKTGEARGPGSDWYSYLYERSHP
jgi:hypothetical protein